MKLWYNCSINSNTHRHSSVYACSNQERSQLSMATRKYTPKRLPIIVNASTIMLILTKGYTTFIDSIDADLGDRMWSAFVSVDGGVYAIRSTYIKGQKIHYQMHRVILSRMLGKELLRADRVDHIDGNGLNNRRCNLRLATNAQNAYNQKKRSDNASGFKGVSFDKSRNKWIAQIMVNYKHIHLGRFETPEEAYRAYRQAAFEYFGEFARFE